MTLEGLLMLAIWVIVIIAFFALVAWGADRLIAKFCPPEWAKGARMFVGVVLLLLLLLLAIQAVQGNLPQLRLKN